MKNNILIITIMIISQFAFSEDRRIDTVKDRANNSLLRISMIKVLAKDNVKELGPILLGIMEEPKEEVKTKMAAISAIAELKYKKGIPMLVDIYSDYRHKLDYREACLEALKELIKTISNDKDAMLNMGILLRIRETDEDLINAYLDAFEKGQYKKDKDVLAVVSSGIRTKNIEIRKKIISIISESNEQTVLPK